MKIMDGCDEAIIGHALVWHPDGTRVRRVIYSGEMLTALLIAQGCDAEEAEEYVSFNQEDAYVGPDTPIIVWMATRDEIEEIAEGENEELPHE